VEAQLKVVRSEADAAPGDLRRRRFRTLLVIFLLNIVSTAVHYGHNLRFLPDYFEVALFDTQVIDAFWFVMTFIGVAGVVCLGLGKTRVAYALLLLYCGCSLLVLGHYNPRWSEVSKLSLTIHLLIWQEILTALLLAGYVRWMWRHPLPSASGR
jgi:hypothetical protein